MGLIRNSNQTKQGLDFTGIQNGKIHPTDIDAVLEFDNEALVLIEIKRVNNYLSTGQRLVLERITDSWHNDKAVAIFATHNFKDDTVDVPAELCRVEKIYWRGEWHLKHSELLSHVLNKLGSSWGIEKMQF